MYMEYNKITEYIENIWDFLCFLFYYIGETDFIL